VTVLLALAGAWLFANAILILGMWFTALRDTRNSWELDPSERRTLTVLLLTVAPVGVARWALLRGTRWQRQAMVQFFVGLPVAFVLLIVLVATAR
jgi:hypothetical protein